MINGTFGMIRGLASQGGDLTGYELPSTPYAHPASGAPS
jgi:hypothetical protein